MAHNSWDEFEKSIVLKERDRCSNIIDIFFYKFISCDDTEITQVLSEIQNTLKLVINDSDAIVTTNQSNQTLLDTIQ